MTICNLFPHLQICVNKLKPCHKIQFRRELHDEGCCSFSFGISLIYFSLWLWKSYNTTSVFVQWIANEWERVHELCHVLPSLIQFTSYLFDALHSTVPSLYVSVNATQREFVCLIEVYRLFCNIYNQMNRNEYNWNVEMNKQNVLINREIASLINDDVANTFVRSDQNERQKFVTIRMCIFQKKSGEKHIK